MMIGRSYEPSFALRWALKDAGHGDEDMAATVEAGRS